MGAATASGVPICTPERDVSQTDYRLDVSTATERIVKGNRDGGGP